LFNRLREFSSPLFSSTHLGDKWMNSDARTVRVPVVLIDDVIKEQIRERLVGDDSLGFIRGGAVRILTQPMWLTIGAGHKTSATPEYKSGRNTHLPEHPLRGYCFA
jgi:hypothetical protein